MTDTTIIPESTDPTPANTTTTPKRSAKRTILFSGIGALAALALAGGGVAVGAAVADDDDDDRDSAATSSRTSSQAAALTESGTSSADELIDAVRIASDAADGAPTAIEASPDGAWKVQLTTDSGDESDVRVAADGTRTVVSTDLADRDHAAPIARLDDATIRSLVSAALANTDGDVMQIDVDDNPAGTYDVTVRTADGAFAELSLDGAFTVTASELDTTDD